MSDSYYNTTGEFGRTLQKYEDAAYSQEQRIKEYFKAFPDAELMPYEVKQLVLPDAEITSIRRALTDLTNEGVLAKSIRKKMSPKGRPNFTWRLKTDDHQLPITF